jgi:hypothetical protein
MEIFPMFGMPLYVNYAANTMDVLRFITLFTIAWRRLHPDVHKALWKHWSGSSPERQIYGHHVRRQEAGETIITLVDGPHIEYRPEPHGDQNLYCAAEGNGHRLTFDSTIIPALHDRPIKSMIGCILFQAYWRAIGEGKAVEWDAFELEHLGENVSWIADEERVAAAEAVTFHDLVEHSQCLLHACYNYGFDEADWFGSI